MKTTLCATLAAALLLPLAGITQAQNEKAAAPAKITVGDFTFAVAKPWADKESTRPMVKAITTWTDPDAKHKPIDCAFYHFGEGQGGSIKANVDRWKGQFQGKVTEDAEDLAIDGNKVMIVHLQGTYLDGPMFGEKKPTADHALLGAILPSEGGHVFLKATGPKAAIEAAKATFRKLATSPFSK